MSQLHLPAASYGNCFADKKTKATCIEKRAVGHRPLWRKQWVRIPLQLCLISEPRVFAGAVSSLGSNPDCSSNTNTLEGSRSPTSHLHWRENSFISSLSEKQACVNKTGGEMRMERLGHTAERKKTGTGQASPGHVDAEGSHSGCALAAFGGFTQTLRSQQQLLQKHMLSRWKGCSEFPPQSDPFLLERAETGQREQRQREGGRF